MRTNWRDCRQGCSDRSSIEPHDMAARFTHGVRALTRGHMQHVVVSHRKPGKCPGTGVPCHSLRVTRSITIQRTHQKTMLHTGARGSNSQPPGAGERETEPTTEQPGKTSLRPIFAGCSSPFASKQRKTKTVDSNSALIYPKYRVYCGVFYWIRICNFP